MSTSTHEDRIEALLGSIAESLARIAANTEPEAPEEPDMQRPIDAYRSFDWSSIGADVVRADEYGAALVEYDGKLWTRRSPENKFGEAIWFSRAAGKDPDGTNRYLRLITFRPVHAPEPISRGAEKAITNGAPPAPAQPARPPVAAPPPTISAPIAAGLPAIEAQPKQPAPAPTPSPAPPAEPPPVEPKKQRKAVIQTPNFGKQVKDQLDRLIRIDGYTTPWWPEGGEIDYDAIQWYIGGHDIPYITAATLPACLSLIEQHVRKGAQKRQVI